MKLRKPVPDAVRAVRGERLGWAVTEDGVALVATPTALRIGDEELPWVQVERVSWQPPTLTITEVAEVEGRGRVRAFAVTDDHRLAEAIRARVTSSIGWTDVRRLEPSGKVRLVARRIPGQDALLWQVVHLDGTDPADPVVRQQVQALVASLRATLG